MHKSEVPLLPVRDTDISSYREEITSYLKSVSWRPDVHQSSNREIDLSFLLQAGKALPLQEQDELSMLKNAVRISADRTILTNTTNHVLNAIRNGYCFGRHISALFEKASGLHQLMQKNKDGNLHQKELPEFHDRLQTQSAVLLFAAASFILHALEDHRAEEADSVTIDFGGIPELSLSRPSQGIQCSLYYLCAYLERSGAVVTDLHFLKMVQLYFGRLRDEIHLLRDSLKAADFFTNYHYKYEPGDFVLQGFDLDSNTRARGISFNRVEMDEIVANRDAKHLFRRYAERLLCFDFTTGRNPMLELGGLPSITMADGKPGTGKSMLIAATATLLKDRCDELGYPFLFWPLPENIISTYQGGSAERALEWFRPMQDSNKIIFAPIDDAENNLEERTRQGVSAGVREFIGVFLRNTEGAYAVHRGNRLISLFTNIPDQIDKAVLSRIQIRVNMDGAAKFDDFVDQDYLWWKKYHKLSPDLVTGDAPGGYTFMEAQKPLRHLGEAENSEYNIQNDILKRLFDQVSVSYTPDDHGFFGSFYEAVVREFPFFSSRDLRNIQKAVDARLTDFDFPEDWWQEPERFFLRSYDEKLLMLKELMKSNLGNLSFGEIRLKEALKYIDTAIRINETGLNRRIVQAEEQLFITRKASENLNKRIDL